MRRLIALAGFLGASYLAAFLGGLVTAPAINGWYAGLIKSALNPPSWIFAPAWTTLYTLMAIAAWRVWQKRETKGARSALYYYAIQLALNVIWSVAFFGLYNPLLALMVIVLLWILIVTTSILFYKIDKLAGILFVPYSIWVSFAAYLNAMIVLLN